MHSQVMTITPALAETWLENNTFNRKVSSVAVRRYASDMASGSWELNHQGIAFDDDGTLVDGQHRLMAIIRSGSSIPMMVTWGASRVGVDELRVRSPAEVVKFGGLSDWLDSKSIQIAKQMATLFTGEDLNMIRSTAEIVDFSERNKEAITFTLGLFHTNRKGLSTAAAKATVAVAYYHFDRETLSEFVESLYSGVVSSPSRSAVIRVREVLTDGGFSGGGTSRKRMAKRMARGIVAFADQQPLNRLHEPKDLPFILPESKR